ncbi:Uncharacterised protein [Mycobacteroides abscessus subsp. abscessus]|nr:Uncharacterised protein [Mycobacteroides abscessus subsp. abscessus]
MFDDDALRPTGGTGGEDGVGSQPRVECGRQFPRRVTRTVGELGRRGQRDTEEVERRVAALARDHHDRSRVVDDHLQAICRVRGVKREVGRADLQDAEDRHHDVDAAGGRESDDRALFHT